MNGDGELAVVQHEGPRHLNISVGRACFTACRGCYLRFGTAGHEPLATEVIVGFMRNFVGTALTTVTLAGEDPLSRPDILTLLREIKSMGFRIHLDSVGTPLLGPAETVFYGRHAVEQINPASLRPFVDKLGIPVDGSTNEIMGAFRTQRKNILNEQRTILEVTKSAGISVSVNTVVTAVNVGDLENIADILHGFPHVVEWQLFQFMPIGKLGYRNRQQFEIGDGEFAEAIDKLRANAARRPSMPAVTAKTRAERKALYVLIDKEGEAWTPRFTDVPGWHSDDASDACTTLGNIHDLGNHGPIVRSVLRPQQPRIPPTHLRVVTAVQPDMQRTS